MEIVLKLVTNQFNPIQITFLRFLIGSIILLPLAVKTLKNRELSLQKKDFIFFSVTGLICVVISMVLYQLSILYCKASIVAILFSCNPVFVILLAYFLLSEKIYKQTIVALIISLAGMLCIMNPLKLNLSIQGLVLVLFSALTFALYSVLSKIKSSEFGGIVVTCFSFMMGSIEMFVFVLLTKISFISNRLSKSGLKTFADIPILHGITLHNLLMLIYISIFVTGLGFTFYFLAMEKTSATTASIVFFIKPAIAPILALIILKESITVNTLIGIALITIGSLINFNLQKQKTPAVDQAEEESTASM